MATDYSLHTALALWSFGLGVFLCAVYDILRLFRLRRKQNAVLLFINDISFCAFSAICMLLLFFNLTYGKVRAYAFGSAFLGFILWRITVSRWVMALMSHIFNYIEKLLISLITRVKALIRLAVRKIYSKTYVNKAVRASKGGFGLMEKLKNEKENGKTQ